MSKLILINSIFPLSELEPDIAKKMYDLNSSKYEVCPTFRIIKEKFIMMDKFTIVELTVHNNHYHGLAACNPNDNCKLMPGIYLAYHRAFDNMVQSKKWW